MTDFFWAKVDPPGWPLTCTPAPKFNVTKLDDREVSGGGPTSSKEEDGG